MTAARFARWLHGLPGRFGRFGPRCVGRAFGACARRRTRERSLAGQSRLFYVFEGIEAGEALRCGKRGVSTVFSGVDARFLCGISLSVANDRFLQGAFQPIRLKGVLLELLCKRFGRFRLEMSVSCMDAHFLRD